MSLRSVLVIATLLIGSCAAGPRNGAVRPAPPGPFDIMRGLFGDFSGLCPREYEYCQGHGRPSICCPFVRGCCEDASGAPICCAGPVYPGDRDQEGSEWRGEEQNRDDGRRDDERPSEYACPVRDITCSQGGRRICCSPDDGCCVDDGGPYCCQHQ